MKVYRGEVTSLKPNQIIVFGSNTEGRHGKGLALWARLNAGAIYGQPCGRQGQSFAIVTKNLKKKTHPSVSVDEILAQIDEFYDYARKHPELEFIIPYKGDPATENLNAYTCLEMAAMFGLDNIPENVVFEEEFAKLIIQLR